jgi:hypothetical protein
MKTTENILKDYFIINEVKDLKDFIQSNGMIETITGKVIIDTDNDEIDSSEFYEEYFENDFEYDEGFLVEDLNSLICDNISDEIGWCIEELTIYVKKSPYMIENCLTILVEKTIKCIKNIGFGKQEGLLYEGFEYDLDKVRFTDYEVIFSLYDDEGWIGDYIVERNEFDKNCKII